MNQRKKKFLFCLVNWLNGVEWNCCAAAPSNEILSFVFRVMGYEVLPQLNSNSTPIQSFINLFSLFINWFITLSSSLESEKTKKAMESKNEEWVDGMSFCVRCRSAVITHNKDSLMLRKQRRRRKSKADFTRSASIAAFVSFDFISFHQTPQFAFISAELRENKRIF